MADRAGTDRVLARCRNMSKPLRVVYARPRSFVGMATGFAALFVLAGSLALVTRLLICWDVFVALYLALVYIMMFRSGLRSIRRNAVLQDDGRFLIPVMTVLGAFASIAAIVFELVGTHRSAPALSLATGTIVLPWAPVHTAFALHYPHDYSPAPHPRRS